MGEVYRPEDIVRRKDSSERDLTPKPIPRRSIPSSWESVLSEIKSLKLEIIKIKQVLRAHGIAVE